MQTIQWLSDNGHYIWIGNTGQYLLSGYVQTDIGSEAQTIKAPLQDGESTYDPTLDKMTITFQMALKIGGTRNVRAKTARDTMKNIVALAFSPNTFGRLIVNNDNGENYARCRPMTKPVIKKQTEGMILYEIELESDYPMWKGEEHSAFMGYLEKMLIYPVFLPAKYGDYYKGVSIDNEAMIDVYPIFEVSSNLEKFGVENQTTGREFEINHEIKNGETMIIDTYEKTVRLKKPDGAIEDISQYMDGDFLTLAPGVNELIAKNQLLDDTPACKIIWRLPRMDA